MQTIWSESSICALSHSGTPDRLLVELRFPGSPAFLPLRRAEHLPLSPAGLQLCSAKQGGRLIRPFPLQPWDPPPSITSLTPPSRRNPRWVRSDKESPAVQTVGGRRRGVVGGTHQHIYFREIKIYAHKQTTEYPERSQGWWFGGGGVSCQGYNILQFDLGWKEWKLHTGGSGSGSYLGPIRQTCSNKHIPGRNRSHIWC